MTTVTTMTMMTDEDNVNNDNDNDNDNNNNDNIDINNNNNKIANDKNCNNNNGKENLIWESYVRTVFMLCANSIYVFFLFVFKENLLFEFVVPRLAPPNPC